MRKKQNKRQLDGKESGLSQQDDNIEFLQNYELQHKMNKKQYKQKRQLDGNEAGFVRINLNGLILIIQEQVRVL